jgi:hypothetical protein
VKPIIQLYFRGYDLVELNHHSPPQCFDGVCRDKFAVLCKSTVIGEALKKMAYKSVIFIYFEQESESYNPVKNSMQ